MQRVGWIGTGIMGASMATHLINAGYEVCVFNRTKSKAEELLRAGATWHSSPAEVANHSDIVFHIVGYPQDVEETILGASGSLAGIRTGGIIVDMTTSSPSLAVKIEAKCKAKGVISLDAPVSGGDVGAKNATLSIMIGGDEKTANDLMPIWNVLGKTIVYHGSAGNGQHAKMVNQTLIAGTMIGLCEALVYAHQAGLNLEKVLESVSTGAASSWSLSNLAPRILREDFSPGFMIKHFLKDLRIVLEESQQMGLKLSGLALTEELYAASAEQGYAQHGTHALFHTIKNQ